MVKAMSTERKELVKELDDLAKTLAKERDNYTCQHCGARCEKKNAHGSHVIPTSAGSRLRWDLQNIKCLCFHCHINWWHKNPTEAGEWYKNKFPERLAYLEAEKLKGAKKWTIEELQELEQEYKEKHKKLLIK